MEDTPPEITNGIFVKFETFNVSFKFGPIFVPSLLISVYIILDIFIFEICSIKLDAKISVCFFHPDKATYPSRVSNANAILSLNLLQAFLRNSIFSMAAVPNIILLIP